MVRRALITIGLLSVAGAAGASTVILSLPQDGSRSPTFSFTDLLASDGITPGVRIVDSSTVDYYGRSDGENGAILDIVGSPAGPASRGRSFAANQNAYRTGYDSSAYYALTPHTAMTLSLPMYASVSAGRDGRANASYYLSYTYSNVFEGPNPTFGEDGFRIFSGTDSLTGLYSSPTTLRRDLGFSVTNDTDGLLYFAYGGRWSMSATGPAVAPVPEPETYGLMALGLAVTGWWARRKQRNVAGGGSSAAG